MTTYRTLTPVVYHPLNSATQWRGPTFTDGGTATFADGKWGRGLSTANSDSTDRVSCSYNPSNSPTDNAIFQFFWKPDHNSSSGANISPISGGYYVTSDDRLQFACGSGVAGGIEVATRTSATWRSNYRWTVTYTSGVWYHFLFILESGAGSNNRIKFYFNGIDQGTGTVLFSRDSAWTFSNTMDFDIGKWAADRGSSGTKGVVDNFKIYNKTTPDSYWQYENIQFASKMQG